MLPLAWFQTSEPQTSPFFSDLNRSGVMLIDETDTAVQVVVSGPAEIITALD